MDFSFAEEPVKIKTKDGVREFKLVEHTTDEFELYLESISITFDRAISKLGEVNKQLVAGQKVLGESDMQEIKDLKEVVAKASSEIVAKLLHPADELPKVSSAWVRANLSWKMREQIMDKQNELDGVETVQDQSFLVEKSLMMSYYGLKAEANRIPTPTKSRSTNEFESSPVSPPEIQQPSDHVSVDDLELDDDGFVQP